MQRFIDLSLALRGSTNYAGATASVLKYTLHRARKAPSIVLREFIVLKVYRSVQQSLLGRRCHWKMGESNIQLKNPYTSGSGKLCLSHTCLLDSCDSDSNGPIHV